MNNLQVRQLDRGQSRLAYFADYKAVFPATSPGGKVKIQMESVISQIQALASKQASGVVGMKIDLKGEDLFKMKKIMRQMGRAADSLEEEIPGIKALFTVREGGSEEEWLAQARAFHANSENYEEAIGEYMPKATWRADLAAVIASVDAHAAEADTAENERGGATGGLKTLFRELGRLGRKAHNIVKNKLEDEEPEKYAAWIIASHLKAAPKTEEKDGNNNEKQS